MQLARELMQTCWGMYKVMDTGLAAEITHFNISNPPLAEGARHKTPGDFEPSAKAEWERDFIVKANDRHNLQRPETVESLFYMWRITHDVKYREWGWEMFKAFVKHTAVELDGGFTSLKDASTVPPLQADNMESFWMVSRAAPGSVILKLTPAGRDAKVLLPAVRAGRRLAARPGGHQHGSAPFSSLQNGAAVQNGVGEEGAG